jgi:hypothetical protein
VAGFMQITLSQYIVNTCLFAILSFLYNIIIAGMDYEPLSATVMFLSSSGLNPVQCQNVTLLDDDTEEDDETFDVQITSSDCILAQTQGTVTIVDDGTGNSNT